MRRRRTDKTDDLESQIKRHARTKKEATVFEPSKGDFETVISTGSTLLDLAISGKRVHGGGLPVGILVEAFGPSGSGKTVLLCEIAGYVQRLNGQVMFHDPEARLNKTFAQVFDLDTDAIDLQAPDKIPEVFKSLREWDVDPSVPNGVFTDSLAALSTDMEMDTDDGDKMGMRRAKEFSEELRKSCRIIAKKKLLMVASNQVRVNQNAGPYGQKYVSPGGEAVGFYSSVRLRFGTPTKIKIKKKYKGKDIEKVVGIETEIEVFKSSVDAPYRKATVIIYFDYGIDDIRANLQYVKRYTGASTYMVGNTKVGQSLDDAVAAVESSGLEKKLKEQTISIWEIIEDQFKTERKKKER